MRYIALFLVLVAASETLPIVKMDKEEAQSAGAPSDVLSHLAAFKEAELGDELSFMFATYQPPKVDPVRKGLNRAESGPLPDTGFVIAAAPAPIRAVYRKPAPDAEAPVPVQREAEEQAITPLPEPVEEAPVTADLVAEEEAITPLPETTERREVSASVLNVRTGPSSRNRVLGAFTLGERVSLTGAEKGAWIEVRALDSELEGWVFSRYLTSVGDT